MRVIIGEVVGRRPAVIERQSQRKALVQRDDEQSHRREINKRLHAVDDAVPFIADAQRHRLVLLTLILFADDHHGPFWSD